MAILLFSIVVLVGFIPAVFCLDRLFAINFARSAHRRQDSKDVFWQPRGIVDTGKETASQESQRPLATGISWLFSTPYSLSGDPLAMRLLKCYRISSDFAIAGLIAGTAYIFLF